MIKWSRKHEAILARMKEEIGDTTTNVRTLCPTRWTVRAKSLSSVIENYTTIQSLWDEALDTTSDTEMKARIRGVASQMMTFGFYFGLVLSEKMSCQTDTLVQSSRGQKYPVLKPKKLQG